MNPKCYFCDAELTAVEHTFKVGPRDEPVCHECHTKTMNRQRTKDTDGAA